MERVIAFIVFAFISPALFILFLLVRLTSQGPFIFKQKRMGENFRPFYIYKIRTMVKNAERIKYKYLYLNQADGPVFKIYNDPRLTTIGKVLWKTGIDEVLQLINVIKGEMSFVGPRPLPVEEAKKIPKKYTARFSVKPGMTSLWIIKGAHQISFKAWMNLDLKYVVEKNLFLDLYIIVNTFLLVFNWSLKELRDVLKKCL